MAKPMHETSRLRYGGAVDADGHVLEPPDLWESSLEPKYRDRSLRIVIGDDGLEALEIGGQPSKLSRRGSPSVLGAMGDPEAVKIKVHEPLELEVVRAGLGSPTRVGSHGSGIPGAAPGDVYVRCVRSEVGST